MDPVVEHGQRQAGNHVLVPRWSLDVPSRTYRTLPFTVVSVKAGPPLSSGRMPASW
ncbi:hypothetical protein [Kibdelosporangium aridum]|uniref:hypothetical protein n=1 Tax=Kibdelosporangium aridum TaxID=2030 RepID=UPI0035F0AAFE